MRACERARARDELQRREIRANKDERQLPDGELKGVELYLVVNYSYRARLARLTFRQRPVQRDRNAAS